LFPNTVTHQQHKFYEKNSKYTKCIFKYNLNSNNINKYKFYCTASNDYGNNVLGFAWTRHIWDMMQLLVQKNGVPNGCNAWAFFVLVLVN